MRANILRIAIATALFGLFAVPRAHADTRFSIQFGAPVVVAPAPFTSTATTGSPGTTHRSDTSADGSPAIGWAVNIAIAGNAIDGSDGPGNAIVGSVRGGNGIGAASTTAIAAGGGNAGP